MMRNLLIIAALLLTLPALAEGTNHEVVVPRTDNTRPFSPAVRTGNLVFLSGQLGTVGETRELAPGGVVGETRQALENIRAVLEKIGLGLADVVKCTVFLADIADYAEMNNVYNQLFPKDPPARSTVGVAALVLGAKVEIECIAAAAPAPKPTSNP